MSKTLTSVCATARVIALLGAIAFVVGGCAQRAQMFRVACVQNGGSEGQAMREPIMLEWDWLLLLIAVVQLVQAISGFFSSRRLRARINELSSTARGRR